MMQISVIKSNKFEKWSSSLLLVLFYPLLMLLLIMTTLLDFPHSQVFATSPQFGPNEIRDRPFDLLNMTTCELYNEVDPCEETAAGDKPIDFNAITYFSDGKTLNATLWLTNYFNETSFEENDTIMYGLYLDADSNQGTGRNGIDYEIENKYLGGKWFKTLYQYSSVGSLKFLNLSSSDIQSKKGVSENIQIIGDLNLMGFPNEYKVMFYTLYGNKTNPLLKMDFSSWISVPPAKISLLTTPAEIMLIPGQSKPIGVQLESDTGTVPEILNFKVGSNPTNLIINVKNKTEHFSNDTFQPASFQPASVEIFVPSNTSIGQYNIPILATVSVNSTIPKFPRNLNTGEDIQEANLKITIVEPPSFFENISSIWETWGSLISFIAGLGIGEKLLPILRKAKCRIKLFRKK